MRKLGLSDRNSQWFAAHLKLETRICQDDNYEFSNKKYLPICDAHLIETPTTGFPTSTDVAMNFEISGISVQLRHY
jgi:hypothetical protein